MVFRECTNPKCRFWYPDADSNSDGSYCPKCGEAAKVVAQIHHSQRGLRHKKIVMLPEIVLVLDNIRSAYNVGSIFRTCDAFGVRQVYLCGITPSPKSPKVSKTALGAESNLSAIQFNNCVDLIRQLSRDGYLTIGLEIAAEAVRLADLILPDSDKFALVLGGEKSGIDPAVLRRCDQLAYIPMQGIKESLNVAVACGISLYHLTNSLSIKSA